MKTVIIMRGLPWTGKSYTAKQLAGDDGLIFSTDEYFYKLVNPSEPDVYNFKPNFLAHAHKWNFVRFQLAVNEAAPLVIVDNTNTTAPEAKNYVEYATFQDYEIKIQEPTSDRWMEIRELLKDKRANKKAIKGWAKKLAEGSLQTHRVPEWAIEKMMWRWENDLTVEQILQSKSFNEE